MPFTNHQRYHTMRLPKSVLSIFVLLLCFTLAGICNAQSVLQQIYFIVSDVDISNQEQIDDLALIKKVMLKSQKFYRDEMIRLGYVGKTFLFAKDTIVVQGKKKLNDYRSIHEIRIELPDLDFGGKHNIQVVFIPHLTSFATILNKPNTGGIEQRGCLPLPNTDPDNYPCHFLAIIAMDFENRHLIEHTTAHEIGHTFGLEHGHHWKHIMGSPLVYRGVEEPLDKFSLSEESAKTLDKSSALGIVNIIEQDYLGDVNKDSYVDLSDVMIVRSAMQNSTAYDTDINNDGVTDEVDLLMVKAKALEAIAAAAPTLYIRKKITSWGALKKAR